MRQFDWYQNEIDVGWVVVSLRGIDWEWRKAPPNTAIVDKRYSYPRVLVGVQMPGNPVYWYSLAEVRAHPAERLAQMDIEIDR